MLHHHSMGHQPLLPLLRAWLPLIVSARMHLYHHILQQYRLRHRDTRLPLRSRKVKPLILHPPSLDIHRHLHFGKARRRIVLFLQL